MTRLMTPQVRTAPPNNAVAFATAGWTRVGQVLTAATVALVAASSTAGLLVDGLYRDPEAVVAMLRGFDLVTLVVAVPLLVVSLVPRLRRSSRWLLVRTGMLAYVAYDYAYYVFGTTFNDLFLLHVAIFATSLYAVGVTLAGIDRPTTAGPGPKSRTHRWVAAILALLGASLAAMWIAGLLQFAITGALPDDGNYLVYTVEMTHLGYVMDLAALVPVYLLAAWLLWHRRPWGHVLGSTVLSAGIVTQISYMSALVFQANADVPGASAFDPIEPVILALYVLGAAALLVKVRVPAPAPRTTPTVEPT